MSDLSNHPIILHSDLYAEHEHAPQTQFVAERRVAFLEALAVSGSVRTAARRARVSHQTCYRARRNCAAFGRAWDAALVVARGAAEAKLADLAMNGVEEEVWYHGELVGTRRRMSDRLLLAHLGRLDRMRSDARVEVLAENFDAMLTRLRRGDAIEVEPEGGADAVSSPGVCNRRSMSSPGEGPGAGPEAGPKEGPREASTRARHGEAPCCAAPSWPECRACPHYPPVARLLEEMAEARPPDAPAEAELSGEPWEVEACQMAAFEAGDADWWRYGADWALHTRDAAGAWVARSADEAAGAGVS